MYINTNDGRRFDSTCTHVGIHHKLKNKNFLKYTNRISTADHRYC